MTTARDIVKDALRESGILALGDTPSAESEEEGLKRLNVLIRSVLGYEVGEGLISMSYSDYQSTIDSQYVPSNVRLYLELEQDTTIDLEPNPQDGARLSILDMADNFSTNNLTLDGNGRLIEGGTTLVLNTNSENREWLYRADTGNWARVSTLTDGDDFPFPLEFEDFFVTSLAMRLNPRYGQEIPQATLVALRRAGNQLKARYAQKREVYSEAALYRLTSNRDFYHDDEDFRRGVLWNY